MIAKITLNFCITESFYKNPINPEVSKFHLTDVATTIKRLRDELETAQTVASLIAAGKFEVKVILMTFYGFNEVTVKKVDANETWYSVPHLMITEILIPDTAASEQIFEQFKPLT